MNIKITFTPIALLGSTYNPGNSLEVSRPLWKLNLKQEEVNSLCQYKEVCTDAERYLRDPKYCAEKARDILNS